MATRKLRNAESGYSTSENEALAVVFPLKKFAHFLLNGSFTALSDQQALHKAFRKREMHGGLTPWLNLRVEFQFQVHHGKGKADAVADLVSRSTDTGDSENDAGQLAFEEFLYSNYPEEVLLY